METSPYTHYYGRHKRSVSQNNVLQSEKKQFRLGGELLREFKRHKYYYKGSESEFIRELLSLGLKEMRKSEISDI